MYVYVIYSKNFRDTTKVLKIFVIKEDSESVFRIIGLNKESVG